MNYRASETASLAWVLLLLYSIDHWHIIASVLIALRTGTVIVQHLKEIWREYHG
tara:strand:+ start:720 stop:881 length:162 start_codon:yes stop_codon:yes gene_type:complete